MFNFSCSYPSTDEANTYTINTAVISTAVDWLDLTVINTCISGGQEAHYGINIVPGTAVYNTRRVTYAPASHKELRK